MQKESEKAKKGKESTEDVGGTDGKQAAPKSEAAKPGVAVGTTEKLSSANIAKKGT